MLVICSPLKNDLLLFIIAFQINVQLVDKIFADAGIRTTDLWGQKRLLHQLSVNHCPQLWYGWFEFDHTIEYKLSEEPCINMIVNTSL